MPITRAQIEAMNAVVTTVVRHRYTTASPTAVQVLDILTAAVELFSEDPDEQTALINAAFNARYTAWGHDDNAH